MEGKEEHKTEKEKRGLKFVLIFTFKPYIYRGSSTVRETLFFRKNKN